MQSPKSFPPFAETFFKKPEGANTSLSDRLRAFLYFQFKCLEIKVSSCSHKEHQ